MWPEFETITSKFHEYVNIDDVILSSQVMTSYVNINVVSESIINYRVTSPSNHCCQISILAGERSAIDNKIWKRPVAYYKSYVFFFSLLFLWLLIKFNIDCLKPRFSFILL